MNRIVARLLAGLALAATSACALSAGPPTPLLWKVSDGDNEVYLLGSFHALKASDYPLAASVDAAFADAEAVAFEIDPREMASPELPMKMMTAAMLPEGSTLRQGISAANWQRLEQYAARRSLPLEHYAKLEPWFLALVISMQELSLLGYDPGQGLDKRLIARSLTAGKRTLGLETADQQIAALDSMSASEQQQSLSEALDDAQDIKARMDKLHALWRAGDAQALDAMLTIEFKSKYGLLYQRLNVARNQAWLPRIRRMLDAEKRDDTLVVVGTMHLLGADGLVSQLRSRGYRVERL